MSAWRAVALAAQFGVVVAGSLIGGAWLGVQLDRQFQTTPTLLAVGVFAGLAASLYLIYLLYRLQA
jgi:F0F1-type ATP synthase assembly protein I